MTRECQVRICERLGVKFPGPTRHQLPLGTGGEFVRYAAISGPYLKLIDWPKGAKPGPEQAQQITQRGCANHFVDC
jgi:hypothetical protein